MAQFRDGRTRDTACGIENAELRIQNVEGGKESGTGQWQKHHKKHGSAVPFDVRQATEQTLGEQDRFT